MASRNREPVVATRGVEGRPDEKPARSNGAGASRSRADVADETRRNIIEVATTEFVDKGLAGARVDVIAAKTNSSKRMIYYYFGSKEELYRSVLENAYASIRAAETELDTKDMPAEAAMRALVVHTFNYHHLHPNFVRLVMNENMLYGVNVSGREGIRERNGEALTTIRAILNKGVAEGVFRGDLDPLSIHMTISAMCFYNQSNRHTLKAGFDIDLGDEVVSDRRRDEIVDAILSYVSRR